ncbi:sensor histidine kinase [Evansella tamaricis]|uniref:Sensor histidine kinase n=1 Tax=Evansella tamaricis TaxID=2069301 RepID=A0ABS6JN17_9BACI|nr:sensor histidine kinase [Evansella tamaricis]MBU9713810.1 sensor histidine kinase [Evansella tamaricis]
MIGLPEELYVFLLNLFFVYFLFITYHRFIERRITGISHEIFIGIFSAMGIVLCMTFPISPFPNFIFDMRQVPFIIGALYGGPKVACFLLAVLLAYRFHIGFDSGFYASILVYGPLLFVLLYLYPIFTRISRVKEKVYLAAFASFLGLLILFLVVYGYSPNGKMIELIPVIILYSTEFMGIVLFVVFIERARSDRIILEELKKLEKLKVVSDIAASISHEVRTPLTVIRGFLQLLNEKNVPEEKKHFYIKHSIEELDRAQDIISDYLTFAKPSLENVELLEINEELEYIVNVVTPYATLHNSIISFQTTDELTVVGERQKLHQCLMNIIKNGIESMQNGGELSIRVRKVNENAEIKIKDKGVGMTTEQINRLGTPYYTTKDKGTGLGTMVVFSIIKIMQGTIKVESEIGKGTTFTVTFPSIIQENQY